MGPVALTRLAGTSFLAALFYSFTSVTQIIVPDERFQLDGIWQARRLSLLRCGMKRHIWLHSLCCLCSSSVWHTQSRAEDESGFPAALQYWR